MGSLNTSVPFRPLNCVLHGFLQPFTNAVEPGFYSTNWLFLGKTHLKLGEKAKAKEWLEKTVAFNGSFAGDEEDKQVHQCGVSVIVNSWCAHLQTALHPFSSHTHRPRLKLRSC